MELAQHVLNGLVTGSVYALVALGVTLVYGLTRLVNFAHGEIVTVGAFVGWTLIDGGWPFGVALLGAGLAGGALGVAMERGAFRFTRATPINGFILSLGLIFVFHGVLVELYGDETRTVVPPVEGVLRVGDLQISYQRLVVIGIAAVLAAALFAILRFTNTGRAIRAFAEDPDTTALMGVDTDRLITMVFLIGSALAGVAGALVLTLFGVTIDLGALFVIKAFAVSLIGGLGSPQGAVVAGLAVGLSEVLGGAYISTSWTEFFGYAVMIGILMIRPSGLFKGAQGAHV